MNRGVLKFHWIVRLGIFVVLGLPILHVEFLTDLVPEKAEYTQIFRLEIIAAYAVFIWTFIGWHVGLKKLFELLAAAFVLVVATVVIGAAVREGLGLFGATDAERVAMNEHLLLIMFMLILSLPYLIFCIQSFSVAGIFVRTKKRKGIASEAQLNFAVALRVFQHVGEVFPSLFLVWREEHPKILVPRCGKDLTDKGLLMRLGGYGEWFVSAFWAWAVAMLMHSLRGIPAIVAETMRILDEPVSEDVK